MLSARVFVPVGYMPAPLAAGGIVLCHEASAATLAMLGDGRAGMHHAGPDHSGEPRSDSHSDSGSDLPPGHEAWERCSFGVGPADAAIAYLPEALASVARPLLIPPPVVPRFGETGRSHYLARAPPV